MSNKETAKALLDFSDLAHEVCDGEMRMGELVEMASRLLNEHGQTLREVAMAIRENQR